jgi:hypothetical protein
MAIGIHLRRRFQRFQWIQAILSDAPVRPVVTGASAALPHAFVTLPRVGGLFGETTKGSDPCFKSA